MKKYNFIIVYVIFTLFGCGFKPNPDIAYHSNECDNLLITNNYALSTGLDATAKQVYKVEREDNQQSYSLPLYQSFINSRNLVSNVMINKYMDQKICRDSYHSNINYIQENLE